MSSLQQLIAEATDDFLVACDWEKNFEICSKITNDTGGNIFTVELRKRFEKGSERTKARAIELLQTAMQNSHWAVRAVHSPEFQRFLLDTVNSKKLTYDDKNKLLNLIRAWGEAFRPGHIHSGFPNFFRSYQFLQGSQQFPGRDDDSNYLPPSAPASSVDSYNAPAASIQQKLLRSNASELDKVEYELEEKISQQELLKEVLQAIDTSVENVTDNDLVRELLGQCIEFQKRIRQVIERVTQDNLLMRMLHYCDQLEEIQNKVTTLMHDFSTRESNPKARAKPSSSFGGLDSPVVLDLNFSSSPYNQPFLDEPKKIPKSTTTSQSIQPKGNVSDDDFDDMFDMLATRNDSKQQETTKSKEAPILDLFSDLSLQHNQPTNSNGNNTTTNQVDMLFTNPQATNNSETIPDVFKDLL